MQEILICGKRVAKRFSRLRSKLTHIFRSASRRKNTTFRFSKGYALRTAVGVCHIYLSKNLLRNLFLEKCKLGLQGKVKSTVFSYYSKTAANLCFFTQKFISPHTLDWCPMIIPFYGESLCDTLHFISNIPLPSKIISCVLIFNWAIPFLRLWQMF